MMSLTMVISILFVCAKSEVALHFGTTTSDFISFEYDMAPFRDSLSICTWIKRIYTSSYPVVLNYAHGNEILISAHGQYNRILGDTGLENLQSKFTTPIGTWFNYCITWSKHSRTIKLYMDGNLVGTDHTSSRELYMGSTLWFNRYHNDADYHVFGGQLFDFNIFSEVLTSDAIRRIAEGGFCFNWEEFSESRILRWDEILTKKRSGSIVEVELNSDCHTSIRKQFEIMKEQLETVTAELNRTRDNLATVTSNLNSTQIDLQILTGQYNTTQEKLVTVTGRLNTTEDALKTVTGQYNHTQEKLVTVIGRLNTTEDNFQTCTSRLNLTEYELQRTKVNLSSETTRCNRTEGRLETCSSALTDIKSQLEGTRKCENITRWDVFYTSPYFNKVLTEEHIEELKSSWDLLNNFVGVNFTEPVVEHFKKYDNDRTEMCDTQISDILNMLGELVGNKVKMTLGILQHFRETHNEAEGPCDD